MDKEEILEKTSKKKAVVGEMEKEKTNNGNWIAIIVAGIIAIAFIIVEGAMGHFTGLYAVAAVCYAWASSMYFCQYFVAHRPWPVLFGAVLHGLGFACMLVLYILTYVGVL